MTHFNLAKLSVACAAAFAFSAASAAPIQSWAYSVSSSFLEVPTTFVASTSGDQNWNPSTDSTFAAQQISWGQIGGSVGTAWNAATGTGDTRSALSISNAGASGTLTTNDANTKTAGVYSHTNNQHLGINSKTLAKTEIEATLTLANGLISEKTTYKINFKETPNSGICSENNGPACPDLFILDGNFSFTFGPGDGYLYTVLFTSNPALGPLSTKSCQDAGIASGICQGYVTAEGAVTNVAFGLSISAQEIPEPTSIALLGVGLLGLAGIRRRQLKNKA